MKKYNKKEKDPIKELLGGTTIIAVGLRYEKTPRNALPIELKIKNGIVIEAAMIYPEPEEISYSLARAAGALQESAESLSYLRWPPDATHYELAGAALQRLAEPLRCDLGPEGLPSAPPALDGLPGAVADEVMQRWPLWVRSVEPILDRVRRLEYRESLTAHKWSALDAAGGALSTLSVAKSS